MSDTVHTLPPVRARRLTIIIRDLADANLRSAAGYYLAGLFGLLLVDPLAIASVLWPGLGVAIVAMLVYGYRVWPGLLLAAFLVAAYPPGFVFEPGGLPLLAAPGVAVANLAQALLAVVLVRRFVGWPSRLIGGIEVFKFLLICGPVCATVGSTISVVALVKYAGLPSEEWLFTWWSWWVGNVLGCLIAVPLLLVALGRPRDLWRGRLRTFAAPFLLTVAFVTALLMLTAGWERARLRLDFERQAVLVDEAFEHHLHHHMDVLYSLATYIRTLAGKPEGPGFRQFAREQLALYPAIEALAWSPVVRADERAGFEAAMVEAGYKNFRITEGGDRREYRAASERPHSVVVQYIEPLVDNRALTGFDLSSDPELKAALDRARDQGELTLTAPVRLAPESDEYAGTLAILPIFAGEGRNLAGRRASLEGHVVEVIRLRDLLAAAAATLADLNLRLVLVDTTGPGEALGVATVCTWADAGLCAGADEGSNALADYQRQSVHGIGGRRLALIVLPGRAYLAGIRTWSAWLAPAGSVILTILTAGLLLMLSGRVALDQDRRRQLESKNTELERFTNSVSHDLRSPLITIRGYVDCLAEDLAQGDTRQASRDIHRIESAANSMMDTLEGLLALARAGRLVDAKARVDMNAVAREAIERVDGSLAGKAVTVAPDLPDVAGDGARLMEVFQNLVENSVKFMGDQQRPEIQIGTEVLAGETVFFVRDNGQGVAADDCARIFEPFERLDPDVAGSGLGLALARRIVELHGGRIWMVSAGAGSGATVYLTLPKAGVVPAAMAP